MTMDQAGPTESAAPGTAVFDYVPAATDYDKALWRFTLSTRHGLIGSLAIPLAFGAAAFVAGVLRWHLDEAGAILAGPLCLVAVFLVRQRNRRSRTRDQYEAHAALGNCRTTLTADGLTTTGSSGEGSGTTGWNVYPWWFETPELFVLTGSAEYFHVLPKRGAHSPEDLVRARALFAEHLRRV
ncbi:YcxB family protein [Streptomyces sp. NBC_00102]|uniref:YcxB family protein n=1 Tax=Streptomyces sp. NBC_00102 TaxID=2975652 RepID=UPI0022504EA3|nr:YcxB family protein [Streptomyces sp. NBC_00102]MCX5397941.1 YcxB family protein [Streptomyces sp. NBC_00102]